MHMTDLKLNYINQRKYGSLVKRLGSYTEYKRTEQVRLMWEADLTLTQAREIFQIL